MTDPEKIVLATFGTLGDIYPFIAVALALKARGFAPIVAAPDDKDILRLTKPFSFSLDWRSRQE